MRDATRLAALVALVLALLAACSRDQETRRIEIPTKALEALTEAAPSRADALRAQTAKDWDAVVAAYAKELAALGDEPVLGGCRDEANYNTACAHARAGRVGDATAAFAASIRFGLRPAIVLDSRGELAIGVPLRLEHVLADADLDPIRKERGYAEALAPYLGAGEPVVAFQAKDAVAPVPAVIVLAPENEDAEHALSAWRAAAQDRSVAIVALAGPVRPSQKERHWILGDGDERWAVAKIRATIDLLATDARVDATRVFVAGIGARPGEAAWAVAFADRARVAGFAAPAARFHAAWHADAIAAAPKNWRVALGAGDAEPAAMLRERGIDAARVEASADESKVIAAVLDAMLGPR
jgi:hypothetical protein